MGDVFGCIPFGTLDSKGTMMIIHQTFRCMLPTAKRSTVESKEREAEMKM